MSQLNQNRLKSSRATKNRREGRHRKGWDEKTAFAVNQARKFARKRRTCLKCRDFMFFSRFEGRCLRLNMLVPLKLAKRHMVCRLSGFGGHFRRRHTILGLKVLVPVDEREWGELVG